MWMKKSNMLQKVYNTPTNLHLHLILVTIINIIIFPTYQYVF
jgi:hypothetical protein